MKSFVNPPFEMGGRGKAVALPRVLENKTLRVIMILVSQTISKHRRYPNG